jgi:uncharacterized repeat protein (TIGR04052 family)
MIAGVIILLLVLAASTVVLSACSGSSGTPSEIHFGVRMDGEAGSSAAVTVRNVQFYVHDVQLLDAAGRPHPFRLDAVAPWQSAEVALVDLGRSGETICSATIRGTPALSTDQTYTGIRFSIGVPFELNHANPLAAAAPLDRSELFWTWQSGHKFLRVDLVDAGREWSFHLGSTGCTSASAVRPPAAPCTQSNVMRVEITGIDPLRQSIQLQLHEFVSSMRAAEHAICTGDYAHNPACADVFAKTGLQADTGACPNDRCDQRLWRAQ